MAAILQVQAGQAISLAALSEPESIAAGRAVDCAGNCIRVMASTPLIPGSLVKLEWNGTLAMGKVTEACQGTLSIEIEHLIDQVDVLKQRNRIWWHTEPGQGV